MALIDKASLLMVPSTYEDGTLYNVLPSGNKAPDETGNHNGYDQTRADFTFSRGSNLAATRVNSDGLIEKGRENLLLQSNQFDTTWTIDTISASITSGQPDKDGGTNAWSLVAKAVNGHHRILQTFTGAANSVATFSVFAKANGYNFLRIVENAVTGDFATFDLSDGSVANTTGIANTATIEAVSGADGWYRCSVAIDCGATTRFDIYTMETSGTTNFLGDGVSGAYIMNAQAEIGLAASSYLDSGATTATAGILEDMPRINYDANGENGALLLEPSRTNSYLHSDYLYNFNGTETFNHATSPEGVQNATLLTKTSASDQFLSLSWSGTTISASSDYTMSIFVKHNGDDVNVRYEYNNSNDWGAVAWTALFEVRASGVTASTVGNCTSDVEDYGSGWYRLKVFVTSGASITASSPANLFRVIGASGESVLVYGAQLEAGSHVSSYVPTYGSAATRGADSCYVDYADAHPNDEGTIFFEVGNYETNSSASGFNKILVLNEASSSNIDNVIYFEEYAGENTILIRKGGSTLLQSTPSYQDLRGSKIAIKWNSSEAKIFIDGSLNKTYTGDASLSPRYIGYDNPYNGQIVSPLVIKEQFHFNEALSDAECISLTS